MPKLLVANRGEIAIRVLRSASELGWQTVAIYCEDDVSHATFADEAVKMETISGFMEPDTVARIAAEHNCTHIHPGYGFLSENPALPLALAKADSKIIFVGPSVETLRIASDKMSSRKLAITLGVNVAPGTRVRSGDEIQVFARKTGFPIIIKALDGGGGRGIRVVETSDQVEDAYKRCLGESPSRQVFVEKALTGRGWKHVEIQVIGDGSGAVNHLWERECSVQRRFQKIVEVAPSRLPRSAVQPLIDASLKLAHQLKYKGLGTFEYLLNAETRSWIFLEVNPRVQVEHTITEEIMDIDLIRAQLLLFTPNTTLDSLSLSSPLPSPTSYAVQLRLTAEDPSKNFQLSPGALKSSEIIWPSGRGVRIDTWLSSSPKSPLSTWTVGTDLDSVLAKIIVRGSTYEEMSAKALRALKELSVGGSVKTNIAVLAGVVVHPDWTSSSIDTLWLERNLDTILQHGNNALVSEPTKGLDTSSVTTSSSIPGSSAGGGNTLLQPGSLFHLTLSPVPTSSSSSSTAQLETSSTKHTLTLASIGQNAFPEKLTGTLQTSLSSTPLAFSLSQSSSAAVSSASFELADPNNATQVASPLTGKVVELHPALSADELEKRRVRKGETLVVLSVMKMENVVVAPFDGYVERLGKGVKVGVILGEGMLLCVVQEGTASATAITSRL